VDFSDATVTACVADYGFPVRLVREAGPAEPSAHGR
jgi:hypothetical protein